MNNQFLKPLSLLHPAAYSFDQGTNHMTQDASTSDKGAGSVSRFARQWHHRPAEPIGTSPLFRWPPDPAGSGRWFAARWLVFGENLIIVGLAILTWYFFQPSLEQMRTPGFGWIAQMFLRNAILVIIVAGGLHYLLHSRKIQGKRLKFDPQDMQGRGAPVYFQQPIA